MKRIRQLENSNKILFCFEDIKMNNNKRHSCHLPMQNCTARRRHVVLLQYHNIHVKTARAFPGLYFVVGQSLRVFVFVVNIVDKLQALHSIVLVSRNMDQRKGAVVLV